MPLTSKAKLRGNELSKDVPGNMSENFSQISVHLEQVKELINSELSNCSDAVKKLVGTFDCCGGKMLRAGLELLCGQVTGQISDKHIEAAAILEMLHGATLLHDDVLDDGQIRRGKPTVNSVFGNEAAVLAGDFLLSKVMQRCAGLDKRAFENIAESTSRLCQGEICEILERENYKLSEKEYFRIIREKTAILFGTCCKLGGLFSGADERDIESLFDFGLNMGIAFQITDDLEDMTGEHEKAGKNLARDLDKKSLTLAMIHLLEQSDLQQKEIIEEKINRGDEQWLIDMLKSQGCLEYAHKAARHHSLKAVENLKNIKESQAKRSLISIAEFAAREVF